jgi:hypothetical protein
MNSQDLMQRGNSKSTHIHAHHRLPRSAHWHLCGVTCTTAAECFTGIQQGWQAACRIPLGQQWGHSRELRNRQADMVMAIGTGGLRAWAAKCKVVELHGQCSAEWVGGAQVDERLNVSASLQSIERVC